MRVRTALGAAVVGLWLIVVGMHVRREYFKSDALLLAEGAQALAPGSYFYAVELNGRVIGVASSRLDTVPEGFLFEDALRLEVPALNATHPATVRTRARLGKALQLLDFDFQLTSEIGRFAVRGEAVGDSVLDLRMEAGGEGGSQTTRVRLDPSTTLPVALPLRMAAAGRLEEGKEFSARIFDPSAMAHRAVSVKVTGRAMLVVPDSVAEVQGRGQGAGRSRWVTVRHRTVPTWVVEESYGGVVVTSWLDQDGRLVKAESPMGFTLRRVPYELAAQQWEEDRADPRMAAGYGAVIENTAIAANVDLDGLEGGVRGLVVRLGNVELEGFDLSGGRQELRGDTLLVRRERLDGVEAAYALPYRGGGAPADELEATPLIQATDPRIVATARSIAAGSTDPLEVARRLNDWVYANLRKDITLSIPSAAQVLEARQGDCNEHTVLYVALARALGLPARTAVGLVHIRGRFYYHAWPEIWAGEWVAVDPTLDQFPADATHLRFVTGGLARQVELIRLIGRLRIDIIGAPE
ncbi:MAG TPA: transglutaminase-like domain-containing protein [Longimicrobiales bacterium]|nr:transglutaminase-like domain-containing protein [Longimicrobiales bacterium]